MTSLYHCEKLLPKVEEIKLAAPRVLRVLKYAVVFTYVSIDVVSPAISAVINFFLKGQIVFSPFEDGYNWNEICKLKIRSCLEDVTVFWGNEP